MDQPALLEMRGITKEFPGVKALDGVNLTVRAGTVHALMGENGAGKSTLMKCLFGIYAKDSGTITLDGKEVSFKSSKEALENGVAMVHQELNQALTRSVTDNLWLGRYPKVGGIMVSEGIMRRRTQEIFEELDVHVDPRAIMSTLPVSQRQMVEIAKAVSYDSKVIVFDEPTSSLTEVEVDLDTGEVKVLRFTQGTDIGQIIDNRMIRMQLQGGVGSASLDTATMEECIYDVNGTGKLLTNSMLEYKCRTFNDMPKHNCVIEESQLDTFMFKAVGIGEISGAAGASAVLMAISNAIGVEVNEYPATPDVILKALRSKEGK